MYPTSKQLKFIIIIIIDQLLIQFNLKSLILFV